MSGSRSINNSFRFESYLLKSNIKFRLTSCNTEAIENLSKSTRPVPVQIQPKKKKTSIEKGGK